MSTCHKVKHEWSNMPGRHFFLLQISDQFAVPPQVSLLPSSNGPWVDLTSDEARDLGNSLVQAADICAQRVAEYCAAKALTITES